MSAKTQYSQCNMESSDAILRTAIDLIRRSQKKNAPPSTATPADSLVKDDSAKDDFVKLDCNGEELPIEQQQEADASPGSLAIEYAEFAQRYPYLFRMCTNVPTTESADNLVKILPMMLRQRDRVIIAEDGVGYDSRMKSATEAVMENLSETYFAPLGIKKKGKI